MATSGTGAIVTRSEIVSLYSDTKYWKNGNKPTGTDQCATAEWINTHVNSPNYIWFSSYNYSDVSQCVTYDHVKKGSSSDYDGIRFNKYQNPIHMTITASGGNLVNNGGWTYGFTITGVTYQAYLDPSYATGNSFSASLGQSKVISGNNAWGKEISGNVNANWTFYINGSSVSNYYSSKSGNVTLSTQSSSTLKIVAYINVGGTLTMGNVSVWMA